MPFTVLMTVTWLSDVSQRTLYEKRLGNVMNISLLLATILNNVSVIVAIISEKMKLL